MDEICWRQAVTLCKLPLGQSEVPDFFFKSFLLPSKNNRGSFSCSLIYCYPIIPKNFQPTVYVNALKFYKKLNIYILICPNQHFTIGQTLFHILLSFHGSALSCFFCLFIVHHAFVSVHCSLLMWCPGSGVVLDCIDF